MLVGICLERSIESIVGMLGILKAGGAFVSLDPSQPQERKAFILADTKVQVLLTLKKRKVVATSFIRPNPRKGTETNQLTLTQWLIFKFH